MQQEKYFLYKETFRPKTCCQLTMLTVSNDSGSLNLYCLCVNKCVVHNCFSNVTTAVMCSVPIMYSDYS